MDPCELSCCSNKINGIANEEERKAERNWSYLEEIQIN